MQKNVNSILQNSLHKYIKKNTSYLQCTSTRWLAYTWPIQIIWCNEEFASGWLLRGKNVVLCCLHKDTTITLYLDAMTCHMSVISIHLSVVTWMKQIYTSKLISKITLKNQIHKLHTLVNPSTSSDILNSSKFLKSLHATKELDIVF